MRNYRYIKKVDKESDSGFIYWPQYQRVDEITNGVSSWNYYPDKDSIEYAYINFTWAKDCIEFLGQNKKEDEKTEGKICYPDLSQYTNS